MVSFVEWGMDVVGVWQLKRIRRMRRRANREERVWVDMRDRALEKKGDKVFCMMAEYTSVAVSFQCPRLRRATGSRVPVLQSV